MPPLAITTNWTTFTETLCYSLLSRNLPRHLYQNSTKPSCVSACLCLVYNMFTKLYCLKSISCLVLPNLLKVSSRLYLSEYVPDFYLLAIPVICPFQDEALKLHCFHPYPPDYFLSQIAVPNWYAGTTSHLTLTVWKQNQSFFLTPRVLLSL